MTGVRPCGSDTSARRHGIGRGSTFRLEMGSDPSGLTPFAALLLALMIASAHAEPLKLEPGKSLELDCQTRSIVVAAEAANATSGSARLKLDPAAGDKADKGKWGVVSLDDAHKGGFAARHKDACAKGCPFDLSAKGEVQLWAPEAKAFDKLGENEILSIAIIKPDTLVLRASTFRSKEIEALEEGTCRVQ